MATVELRWTEERVDNIIALLDERLYRYNMKLRDYFNQDKKKAALDEIAAVLGITDKLRFLHLLRSMIATMTADATTRTSSSRTIRHEYTHN